MTVGFCPMPFQLIFGSRTVGKATGQVADAQEG